MYEATPEQENQEILKKYRELLKVSTPRVTAEGRKMISKAFRLALHAHKDMRRRSGEPYIYHPLAVAYVTANDIGLGATSITCALLHDVVEDTDYTLDDIRDMFGDEVARIIDGLTKIEGVEDTQISAQAENFRKVLLTLSEDVRAILIKLADRLHNMRTLDSMPREKQLKIASETSYLYAPLAHRLGLYSIKTELEDLVMKYTDPEIYREIAQKIADTSEERDKFVGQFIESIREALEKDGLKIEILSRIKSIYSIWNKMKKKNIPFEEIYDLFAIRVIIDTDKNEKNDCFRAYNIITSMYRPNPERFRDWIAVPKANGYESLHTTVMSNAGKWVEVQIRSRRMDEIAEKGYAAHWKYKNQNLSDGKSTKNYEQGLDEWLTKVREILDNKETNALKFLADIKMNLFSEEIYVFTPTGDMRTLPLDSTALDFAYAIHTKLGESCIGAKVNHVLVPISYRLKSGDQIEIITSKRQHPHAEWLNFIVTARAKENIEKYLRDERIAKIAQGETMLQEMMKKLSINIQPETINRMMRYSGMQNPQDLYFNIASGVFGEEDVKKCFEKKGRSFWDYLTLRPFIHSTNKEESINEAINEQLRQKPESLLLDEDIKNINYTIAKCCKPIDGDQVIGFIMSNNNIEIHRTNCPEAIQLMSKYGNRIVKAKWRATQKVAFLAGLLVSGVDEQGLLNKLTSVVSAEMNLNIRSVNFETNEGLFTGILMLYVQNLDNLKSLMNKISQIPGVEKVERINSYSKS